MPFRGTYIISVIEAFELYRSIPDLDTLCQKVLLLKFIEIYESIFSPKIAISRPAPEFVRIIDRKVWLVNFMMAHPEVCG